MKDNNFSMEAHDQWGNTDAYREHEKKTKNYTKEKWAEMNEGLMAIFTEFAECENKGICANSPEVQSLVVKLQEYITQSYYICTGEILAGLGQMYVADERFKKNIDRSGEGTATFASEAIAFFCNRK